MDVPSCHSHRAYRDVCEPSLASGQPASFHLSHRLSKNDVHIELPRSSLDATESKLACVRECERCAVRRDSVSQVPLWLAKLAAAQGWWYYRYQVLKQPYSAEDKAGSVRFRASSRFGCVTTSA